MRNAFCAAMVQRAQSKNFTFLTGDLGFMALEPLQAALGPRFINAGVAEQNMVSVAAGMASMGEQVWTYSIAPFLYARAFEQIRNDVCLHHADVKLIGNGGGYGYGVMGATHHALEDYGILLTLPGLRAYVPAFAADVEPIVARMAEDRAPNYLRLGRCEKPANLELPAYAAWRQLMAGDQGVLIIVGPNAGGILAAAQTQPRHARPEIWVVSELQGGSIDFPPACAARIEGNLLCVLEEHVPAGSFGASLAAHLLSVGLRPKRLRHYAARGYPSGSYGSQAFHRVQSGLDAAFVLADIAQSMAA